LNDWHAVPPAWQLVGFGIGPPVVGLPPQKAATRAAQSVQLMPSQLQLSPAST
jgi:hypothetical protein